MPLTNAEKMRRKREKLKREGKYEEYKARNKESAKRSRERMKKRLLELPLKERNKLEKKVREQNREKLRKFRELKAVKEKQIQTGDTGPFKNKSTLGKAKSRALKALPSCPEKRLYLLHKLLEEESKKSNITFEVQKESSSRHKLALSEDIIQKVTSFFLRDDISRNAPGMKDSITIKNNNGQKEKIQIRHLYSSIKETYRLFTSEYGKIIGKSKFAELRPKHVLLSSKLPRNVCLCKYHENYILALEAFRKAIPQFESYTHSFPLKYLCKPPEKKCWLGECNYCNSCLREKLSQLITGNEDLPLELSWFVWQKNSKGQLTKAVETGTIFDLENYILKLTPNFFKHVYIKRNQAVSYEKDKRSVTFKNFRKDTALIQVDFSENYSCIAQDEVQSFHWVQPQITLFTCSLWYLGKQHSIVIVSNNLDHSKESIVVFLDRLFEEIPPTIKYLKIWSDGPSSQFKNRYIAACMDMFEKKYNFHIIWNFFASSHGKGPVDGIGGALKRKVRNIVTARQAIVLNASDFVNAVQKDSTVQVIEMPQNNMHDRINALNLPHVFSKAKEIKGISKCHVMSWKNGKLLIDMTTKEFLKKDSFYYKTYGSESSDEEAESDNIPLGELKRRKIK